MSYLALFAAFEYLSYGSTAFVDILILSVRDRIYTPESDVYKHQILTYKDAPRTERVK